MPEAPVTPEVVKWAIDESGMSVENIASRVGAEVSDVEAWMHGASRPTKGQLTKLANTLKRPRVLFFLPEAPTETSLPDGLRRPAGERSVDHSELTFDERLWVRRARHLQEMLERLAERPPHLPAVPRGEDETRRTAEVVREWTGVTWAEQQGWKDARTAFRGWREALERNGIAVLAVPLGKEGVRGFALNSSRAPMVAVNTADGYPARCFTLFHELSHLARRDDTSCASRNGGGTERWCDRVASHALMPRPRLTVVVESAGLEDLDLVQHVADHFKVSLLAAAVALEDTGFVDNAYVRARDAWPYVDRDRGSTGGRGRSTPRARIDEYGAFAVGTIIDALGADRINELDASDYLRLDRTLLPAAREQLSA